MPKPKPKKRARKRKGRATGADGRLDEFVRLQKRAIDRWSKYSINTARLTAAGKMSPKEWIKEYTDLTSEVFEDVVKLVRLVFPSAAR